MVLALDLLSRIASRYGRYGRRVFEANQYPMVRAMQLFECMPFADAEKMLVEPLKTWLKDPPEYDPEGWALSLHEEFGPPLLDTNRGLTSTDRNYTSILKNPTSTFPPL